MPLIIITGLPCSGKTHRAAQLAADFAARIASDPSPASSRRTVLHLPSYHSRLDSSTSASQRPSESLREQIYTSAAREKTARAEEFSAVQRALGRDVLVIADGLNYIKGYRYQLWCEAKAAATRCVVVHVAAGEQDCAGWNALRAEEWGSGWGGDGLEGEGGVTAEGVQGVMGMVPESHTAVYGDRGRGGKGEGEEEREQYTNDKIDGDNNRDEDLTTLKSLSLNAATPAGTTGAPPSSPLPPQTDISTSSQESPPQPELPPPTSAPPYTPQTLASLIMRYEPPSPFSRWDTPLFTLPATDRHPPYAAIWAACFPSQTTTLSSSSSSTTNTSSISTSSNAIKPHASTTLPASTAPDALQTQTSATAAVVTALLAAYSANPAADPVAFRVEPDNEFLHLTLPPETPLTQPMLQRLRRKYTALQRGGLAHGVGVQGGGRQGVVKGFVRFLEAELGA